MRFGVMITNNADHHPAWKHADVSAFKLIVDPRPESDPDGTKAEAARVLRHRVRAMLEAHHETVSQHEQTQLKALGAARHQAPLQPEKQHLDAAVADVVALTKGTALEAHYARPEVQAAMREVLAHEFRTQQYIHRENHRRSVKEH